jgi:hypothetical protein
LPLPRCVGSVAGALPLFDPGLPLRGAALALCGVEQRTLMIELLQCQSPLIAHARDAGGRGEQLRTLAFTHAGLGFHRRALAIDPSALGRIVAACSERGVRQQARQRRNLK